MLARTGYDRALFDWLEADAEVETLRCWVVRFEADLDALCTGLGEKFDAGGEYVAGKSSSLVLVFGAHGFDEARGGFWIEPEQSVRSRSVVTVEHNEVEVGAVQRCLDEARLNVGSAALDHMMRS